MTIMKLSLTIFSLLIFVFVILLFIKGINSRSGTSPSLVSGKLAQCSEKPNCVCSEYKTDSKHYVKSIVFSLDDRPQILSILKDIILGMGGSIDTENSSYLSSQFSSRAFGFVDDLEIRLDVHENVIHVRSSSRVGTSDLGVNRKRINTLKNLYKEKTTKKNL